MTRALPPLLALATASTIAHAELITQSFTYDWNSNQTQHPFSFNAFDDMAGTRQLTAARLGFAGIISMELTASTTDPRPVHTGEWSVEASHTVVAFFNGGGLNLLQGIGGQFGEFTGELGGGVNGQPGTPYIATDTLNFANTVDIDPSELPNFYGTGQFTGFMDAFYDAAVTPPLTGQWIDVLPTLFTQTGTVTLTYEYTIVPAPASLALLGLGGLVGSRRRR